MLLSVKKISYGYVPEKILFEDMSFSLDAGNIMTILGPNGVGKSTLLDCLCRLKTPLSGKIYMDGKPIERFSLRQLASIITLVPQTAKMVFEFTVREYVVMGCAPRIPPFGKPGKKHYADAHEAMEELDITRFSDRIFTQLSGGEQQQVSLAKALAQRPKIILLDEPTSSLDVGNQQKTLRLIKKMADLGFCIIMTTHNPDHAIQLGGLCAIMHPDGYMVIGPPERTLKECLLSEIYKSPLRLLKIEELDRHACLAPKI